MSTFSEDFETFWSKQFLPHTRGHIIRNCHLVATGLAVFLFCRFVIETDILSLVVIPFVHTGIVLASHKFVEQNAPLQMKHPLLASIAELRLFFLWCAWSLPSDQGQKSTTKTPAVKKAATPKKTSTTAKKKTTTKKTTTKKT